MFSIRVPATTANVGPGFDSLGMALSIYNEIEVEEIEKGLEIEVRGLGRDKLASNEENLIYRSMEETFKKIGQYPRGLRIRQYNGIPISRGLGSSAACIVGGIMAANALKDSPLSREEILQLAVEIEGHPDNVTPALFGGLVVSASHKDKVQYIKSPINNSLKFIVAIPQVELSTRRSRGVLPKAIPFEDAVFNVGKASLLVAALISGDLEKIAYGLQDRLHQPYRIQLMPSLEKIFQEAEKQDLNQLFLSGAGPSLVYLTWDGGNEEKEKNFYDLLGKMPENWDIQILRGDNKGARFK